MKTSAILLLNLMLMVVIAEGQTVTASELILKAGCTEFDCFNEFITAKGFSFEKTSELGNVTMFIYLSDELISDVNPVVRNKNVAVLSVSDNKKTTMISFRTANKSSYLELLASFKNKGFKAVITKQKDSGNAIETSYRSKDEPSLFLSVTIDKLTRDDQQWTSYDFELSRN